MIVLYCSVMNNKVLYKSLAIFLITVTDFALTKCQQIITAQWHLNDHPDADLSTPQLIEKYGYPVETHEVTTEDGYILTLFRIPRGRNITAPRRKVVLLQHGNTVDSSVWVFNDADKNLVYQLADLGFDCWMPNYRGTLYSRKHKTLTVRDNAFYQFTMDDIGKYDVPAMIDYILAVTGQPQLIYVGHSIGGPIFHMCMHNYPEYNQKVSLYIGMSPAVYVKSVWAIPKLLAVISPIVKVVLDLISAGTGEFPPMWIIKIAKTIGSEGCSNFGYAKLICQNLIFLAVGFNPTQTQIKNMPVVYGHLPTPGSVKVVEQVLQQTATGRFQKYDYGRRKNLEVYGKAKPPLYSLKRTLVPVALFYGDNDQFVPGKDVVHASKDMPNLVYLHRIKDPQWNHLDYFIAKNVNEMLNVYLVELLLMV